MRLVKSALITEAIEDDVLTTRDRNKRLVVHNQHREEDQKQHREDHKQKKLEIERSFRVQMDKILRNHSFQAKV
jgi:hypothetical protein